MSYHKGLCKSLKLAHKHSTKRLESFCEMLEHLERVRSLRASLKYYEKFFQEHPEYKVPRQSEGSYLEDYRRQVISEGTKVESYFGPSPREP